MSSYGSLPSPLSSHFPLTPRHSSPFSPVHSSTKSQGMFPSFFGGRSRSSSSSSVRSISEKDRLEVMHNIYTKLLDPHHLDTIRQYLIGVHSTGRRSNVLDVGTGTGQWSLNLGNSQPFSDIISVDHSWSNFGTGRSFNGNVEYHTVDFLKPLPWLPNSFDLIHVRGLLLDIPNYHLLIERLALLLRPGGMLVIIETEPRYLSASGGPVSDNLQVWYECIRSAFAARQVDVELPSRLPVILAASGVFRNPAITVEAGMPSAGYVTGGESTSYHPTWRLEEATPMGSIT